MTVATVATVTAVAAASVCVVSQVQEIHGPRQELQGGCIRWCLSRYGLRLQLDAGQEDWATAGPRVRPVQRGRGPLSEV